MTRLILGASIVAVSCAALVSILWALWRAGRGQHRAPHRAGGPLLQLPPGTPGEHATDAETLALLLDADRAGFAYCPAEGQTAPHFLHGNGARTCCRCETTTAGDQT